MISNKRVACWMSEKKLQKFNWQEFENICYRNGLEPFKLNLDDDIEAQGPFPLFLHKLTDIITMAKEREEKSYVRMAKVEIYLANHPTVIVVDPIIHVERLLDRYKCYSIIHTMKEPNLNIFTPNFCEIKTTNVEEISEQLRKAEISYPFICKPTVGHGAKAHEMSIIFNERCLKDLRTPCVAQSFVNHNAVLYKVFIVGEKIHVCERPSLKNFYPGEQETIYFDSSSVSKATSQSQLTVLDAEEKKSEVVRPNKELMEMIALSLRDAFGLDLLGVDIVIENVTGKYAVIDVNSFPGYDGFPDFFTVLVELLKSKVIKKK